jgi:uncharacterized protein (TIGR00369 family)
VTLTLTLTLSELETHGRTAATTACGLEGNAMEPGTPARSTATTAESGLPPLANTSPFLISAGLVIDSVSGTRVTGHIDLGPDHHTPWGVVHGGVYTTAVESAASVGASVAVLDQRQFAVGVNNNTDFLRPMTAGRVDVLAEPISQGRVQQLWQVTITRHDDGKPVVRATVRLQNVDRPASGQAGG